MTTLLHSESKRLYSWWWDSHISPKNSKWLHDNLTDMDGKVKAMIKLIEEDADSFARRAEMYYKKRPELMKLVEEFYRAYRALAERYNNATGELRQAHRTMAQAFPDQLPFALGDDASSSFESDAPETPHQIRSFFDPEFQGHSVTSSQGSRDNGTYSEESNDRVERKGLKQHSDNFRSAEVKADETSSIGGRTRRGQSSQEKGSQLSHENQKLKSEILGESERASKAETELETLRRALAKLEAERDSIFLQYQQTLGKLLNLENNLRHAQQDSKRVDELASEARTEIEALKETLKHLEAERDTTLLQYRQSSERLTAVEGLLSKSRKDSMDLSECIAEADMESKNVQDLIRVKVTKEDSENLYKQCLKKIAKLENKLAVTEESLKRFSEDSEKAERKIESLKQEIKKVNEERDHVAVQYDKSLQIISELQHKLCEAQAENSRLDSEILVGSAKLRDSEDQCVLLGKLNESLQLEAQSLARKIAAADEEHSQRKAEQDNLMVSLQQEHSRFSQLVVTLLALQNLHSQSQEEQSTLASELRNGLKMMKDLDTCKRDLEVEIHRLKDENHTLSDLNSSSSMSQKNLQEEVLRLRDIKEKLEAEVQRHAEQSDALQVLVHNLKEEIEASVRRYQDLVQQLESVGLDPEGFDTAVKGLQDEYGRLREISAKDMADREVLLERLQEMEQLTRRNTNLETSLLEMKADIQKSKEKAKGLQESFDGLNEEKSSLIVEKSALLSQLQIITETMQNLLAKNTLQTSLRGAAAELEGLRAKSKGLEDFCQFLSNERSSLLAERSNLISRLEVVEQKLEKLETRFTNLENKYSAVEKEKHSTLSQVEDLRISLNIEKQERACLVLTSEARLSGLEGRIHDLQEENKYRKKEFEDQLEKAVNAQVEIFILQKFVQDMEDKNYDLFVECQQQIETAKCTEKLITELECENMIQQVEAEVLMDKINSLRAGIGQVLKALAIENGSETEFEQNILPHILANIKNIQCSMSESKDENQQLSMEKSILWTLLGQLHNECTELTWRKTALEQQSYVLTQQLLMVENEKHQLMDTSRKLKMEIIERGKREEALTAEVKNLHLNNSQLQEEYFVLRGENLNCFEQNRCLELELLHTKEEKSTLEEQNNLTLAIALACHYQCVISENYGTEKALELNEVLENMNTLGKAYRELEDKATGLEERLLVKEIENLALNASLKSFEEQRHELITYTDQLRLEVLDGIELLRQRNCELAEANTKLKATKDINSDLCCTIECLEKDHEGLQVAEIVLEKHIVDLSEQNNCQEKEIVHLRETNEKLEFEMGKLQEKIQECQIKEVILTSELHERSNEFELWEAEAASFYFDLQISSIHEVLYRNKVLDLGNLCEGLGEVTNQTCVEIERMKQRVASLETEADALKSELNTCLPLIASLKDNIALLEKNPILQSQLHASIAPEEQEKCDGVENSLTCSHGLSELQKLQNRIKVIEDILEKEKEVAAIQERHNAEVRLEVALKDIEDLKAQITKNKQEEHRYSVQDSVSETSECKSGAEMKDIPLDQASGRSLHGMSQRESAASDDQMLELWEAAEQVSSNDNFASEVQQHGTDTTEDEIVYTRCGSVHRSSDPTPESQFEEELGIDESEVQRRSTQMHIKRNQNDVLERLATDTKKLMNLQVSIEEFKRKLDSNKKRKKTEDTEYNSFKSQLESTGNSVVQLMQMNRELMRNIEESSMTTEAHMEGAITETESVWQKKVSDQAQREAENISILELELQQMQYGLLRLRDEKSRGKDGTSRSSAAVLLREFFYSRGRKSKKPKKVRFCGCLRPSTAKN